MKYFYKIFFLSIIIFTLNCNLAIETPEEEENNISTIIGKWRCIKDSSALLFDDVNSIYIFKTNNTGIHVTFSYFDGTGILEKFNWQTYGSGDNKTIELDSSSDTSVYDYYFDGNKLIFDDNDPIWGGEDSFINIYSDDVSFDKYTNEIEENNSNDTGNDIPTDGTPIYGVLESGDIDCFTFYGGAGYNYYVNVDYLTGDNCNLLLNWYAYEYYSDGGYYYWDNFASVNENGIDLGEYDNLRISGSGGAKTSIRISDINGNECTYLLSVFKEKQS